MIFGVVHAPFAGWWRLILGVMRIFNIAAIGRSTSLATMNR